MKDKPKNKKRKVDIYEKYRRILRMPSLTDKEIDEMRKRVGLLARSPRTRGSVSTSGGRSFARLCKMREKLRSGI